MGLVLAGLGPLSMMASPVSVPDGGSFFDGVVVAETLVMVAAAATASNRTTATDSARRLPIHRDG
jgi:hypothetical protein